MAYDESLARRIRALLADEPNVTERAMFGGLAFLIEGNLAVGASGQGGIMLRVDPAETSRRSTGAARPMLMRGKPVRGWLRLDAGDVGTERELAEWVDRAASYARSLPSKKESH